MRSRHGSVSLAGSPLKKRESLAGSFRQDPLSPGRRMSIVPTNRTSRASEIGSRFGRALDLGNDAQTQTQIRSVSRSRSPMPPLRRLFTDESTEDSLVNGLQEIIAIATDVTEMTVSTLLSRPAECQAKVADVVSLGELWKEHPDWPGKEWYYQLLLAVASLSRVVEWWETEKGFWNWDDEDDIGQFTFIMKPIREAESQFSSPLISARDHPEERPESQTMHSCPPRLRLAADEDSILSPPLQDGPGTTKTGSDFARFEAIEDLQLQAERAKSVNIVLELSLDGDTIEWVNPAWQEVLG
jgi:serine/threonine-protein kinase RIM15